MSRKQIYNPGINKSTNSHTGPNNSVQEHSNTQYPRLNVSSLNPSIGPTGPIGLSGRDGPGLFTLVGSLQPGSITQITNNSIIFRNINDIVNTVEKYTNTHNGLYFQCNLPLLQRPSAPATVSDSIYVGTDIFFGVIYSTSNGYNYIHFGYNINGTINYINAVPVIYNTLTQPIVFQIYQDGTSTTYYLNGTFQGSYSYLPTVLPVQTGTFRIGNNSNSQYPITINNIVFSVTGMSSIGGTGYTGPTGDGGSTGYTGSQGPALFTLQTISGNPSLGSNRILFNSSGRVRTVDLYNNIENGLYFQSSLPDTTGFVGDVRIGTNLFYCRLTGNNNGECYFEIDGNETAGPTFSNYEPGSIFSMYQDGRKIKFFINSVYIGKISYFINAYTSNPQYGLFEVNSTDIVLLFDNITIVVTGKNKYDEILYLEKTAGNPTIITKRAIILNTDGDSVSSQESYNIRKQGLLFECILPDLSNKPNDGSYVQIGTTRYNCRLLGGNIIRFNDGYTGYTGFVDYISEYQYQTSDRFELIQDGRTVKYIVNNKILYMAVDDEVIVEQSVYFELNSPENTMNNVLIYGIELEYIDLRADVRTTDEYSLIALNDPPLISIFPTGSSILVGYEEILGDNKLQLNNSIINVSMRMMSDIVDNTFKNNYYYFGLNDFYAVTDKLGSFYINTSYETWGANNSVGPFTININDIFQIIINNKKIKFFINGLQIGSTYSILNTLAATTYQTLFFGIDDGIPGNKTLGIHTLDESEYKKLLIGDISIKIVQFMY